MVINQVPGHPPGREFGMHLPTMPPEVLPCPKGVLSKLYGFGGSRGGHIGGIVQPVGIKNIGLGQKI